MLKELEALGELILNNEIELPYLPNLSNRNDPRIRYIGLIEDEQLQRLHSLLHGQNQRELAEHLSCRLSQSTEDERTDELEPEELRNIRYFYVQQAALSALYDFALRERFPDLLDKTAEQQIWVSSDWQIFLIDRSAKKS
ncbi:MAG: hypothetical protein V1738_01040 [Patescibacteria group bacterium]